ncbi:MAG: TRAP transporter small permease [Alphaproteobacteria bacterium]|nr:TRAP transporter small permease [Alphaproteobacteria bacterium]MCW5739203.1 TRAP transporter small permease [Alphaproteobacteria bacterium]
MSLSPSGDVDPTRSDAPPAVRRVLEIWHRVECWVAVACFAFIALIMIVDVFGRELLGPVLAAIGVDVGPTGIFAAARFAMIGLIIGAFMGVGIATATGAHLVPRVGFGWVPKAWGPAMDRLADVLTGLFLLGFVWFGVEFVRSTAATELRMPVLDWLVWPIQTAIPLGFLSAALRYFVFAAWPGARPRPPEFQE